MAEDDDSLYARWLAAFSGPKYTHDPYPFTFEAWFLLRLGVRPEACQTRDRLLLKQSTFGFVYGTSPQQLVSRVGLTPGDHQRVLDQFRTTYPNLTRRPR